MGVISMLGGAAVSSKPCVYSVDTTKAGSGATVYKLPTVSTGGYNMRVLWGDGSQSVITSYNQAEITKTYSGSGTYTITINGLFGCFYASGNGDGAKIVGFNQFGCCQLGTSEGSQFSVMANIGGNFLPTDVPDLHRCTSVALCFYNNTGQTAVLNVQKWPITKKINNISHFSRYAPINFTGLSLNSWDVQSCTDMQYVFRQANFGNCNISLWQISQVTNMWAFMYGCGAVGDISRWNIQAVTSLYYAFGASAMIYTGANGYGVFLPKGTTDLTTCWWSSPMTTANYNELLSFWGANAALLPAATSFSTYGSHYDASTGGYNGTAGRALLVARGWTITGDTTP